MSQLIPFEEVSTSKRVPSSTKILESLGNQDIVKERYTVSTQPYSGQGAGIGPGTNQKIIFKIINNADYVDLTTAYLTFQAVFAAGGATLNNMNFEDNVLSWFTLVRTLVNDQVVEEINNFNIWANLITYASMSKSYYETAASFMGCYRHSKYIAGGPRGNIQISNATGAGGAPISGIAAPYLLDFGTPVAGAQNWEQLDNGAPSWVPNAAQGAAPTLGSGANDTWVCRSVQSSAAGASGLMAAPTYWCAPLAGYLGLFSLDKYFPLRNVASIGLELTLPTTIRGVMFNNLLPVAAGNGGVGAQTLQLNNLYIHYDCVRMSDAYYALMDSELNDPNGLGVQFTVNTVEGTSAQITNTAGTYALIASKGTRYLKSFWCVQQPQFAYQAGFVPPSSAFLPCGTTQAQLVVNSKRYPQLKIDNFPRFYEELAKSVNKYHSVVGDSIITYPKYILDCAPGDADFSTKPDLEYGAFIMGFNLEQVLDAPEVQLQGENTLTAGFQMQLEISKTLNVSSNAYMFPHFAKVLKVKAATVQVLN